ncbi:MAG: sugar phosphate isomerase/epimerase, partial [Planctomycetia bacterium]|nr:sugar phosphate isomerase/epimerase [Planctomycetia bacterium]
MRPGYNTNGFAHHRLEDAVEILRELGYESIALTVDYCHPPPTSMPMFCVIETGARFLLDPRRKHQPTLVGVDSGPRRAFLRECIALCSRL